MKPVMNISSTLQEVIEDAKADGVICNICEQPHDIIRKKVERGATEVAMNGLGHIWICSNCKGKYH